MGRWLSSPHFYCLAEVGEPRSIDTPIKDQAFHRIAVIQGGAGVMICVDGAGAGASGVNSGFSTDHLSLQGVRIGGGHWRHLKGALEALRPFPRALRPDEIAALAAP